jgi:protein involved in polysaccharide export with SLBB domain
MKTIFTLIVVTALCACAAPDMSDPVPHMIVVKGEVQNPGDYPLLKGMTARQAIEAAGGYSRYAAGIRVKREGETILRKRGLEWRDESGTWDIPLQDKDIVIGERMFE